jgi:ribosomal protein S6 kinase alpha-5
MNCKNYYAYFGPTNPCSDKATGYYPLVKLNQPICEGLSAYECEASAQDGFVVEYNLLSEKAAFNPVMEQKTSEMFPLVCENDFNFLKLLGKGGGGKIYLARKLRGVDEGMLYAVKIITKKNFCTNKGIENLKTERSVLEQVSNRPFLANLHYAFQNPTKLFLVMDFAPSSDLFTQMTNTVNFKFSEEQARFYLAEIIIAIEQLHKMRIIYRDLKLENILVDSEGHIVLTDFGLSKQLTKRSRRTYTFCGTLDYMAPEIVSRKFYSIHKGSGYDIKADWWSLGVLATELMTGKTPFGSKDNNSFEIEKKIKTHSPLISQNISDDARNLITMLLQKDPKIRLASAAQIKTHPFFSSTAWDKIASNSRFTFG